jgi:hypothetical protein
LKLDIDSEIAMNVTEIALFQTREERFLQRHLREVQLMADDAEYWQQE